MFRRTIMLFALMAIFVSFSLSASEIKKINIPLPDSNITVDSSASDTIRVEFTPLSKADRYDVSLFSSSGKEISKGTAAEKNEYGKYEAVIEGLESDTEYTLEIKAERSVDETYFTLQSIPLRTAKKGEGAPKTAPMAWLDNVTAIKNDTFSARIHIEMLEGLEYRLFIERNPNPFTENEREELEIEGTDTLIEGITTRSRIIVEHGRNGNWSKNSKLITFPSNINMYSDEDFILTVKDGVFSWSGVDVMDENVLLYRYSEKDGTTLEAQAEKSGSDGSGVFEYTDRHSLSSGLWYAVYGSFVSEPSFLTSSPMIDVKTNEKGAVLTWTEPEGEKISYIGIPEPEKSGNVCTLTLKNLDSDTETKLSFTALFDDGRTADAVVSFRTDSFEGIYAWYDNTGSRDSVENFVVRVEKAPEGSKYAYYIYTHPDDEKKSDSIHRLMPLVDETNEEDRKEGIPDDFVKIKNDRTSFTSAYIWNEAKWNSTSMHPAWWRPGEEEISHDSYRSQVETKAMGMLIITETDFDFFLDEWGRPMLLFSNKAVAGSTIGIVNGALYKNMAPRKELGEDEFTYALKKIRDL